MFISFYLFLCIRPNVFWIKMKTFTIYNILYTVDRPKSAPPEPASSGTCLPPESASLPNLPQFYRSQNFRDIFQKKKISIFSKTFPLPGPVYHMYGSGLWAKLKSELGCAPVILWKLANLYHFLSTDKRVSPFLDVITVTQQEHKAGSTINRGTCYTHSACACNWLFDYLQ